MQLSNIRTNLGIAPLSLELSLKKKDSSGLALSTAVTLSNYKNRIPPINDRPIKTEHSHFCFQLEGLKLTCHINESRVNFGQRDLATNKIGQTSGEFEIMDERKCLKKYKYAFYTYQNHEGKFLGMIKLYLKDDETTQKYVLIECSTVGGELFLDQNRVESIIKNYCEIISYISFV